MNQGDFLYTLEKGSKKHVCPSCLKKRLVRYINKETGEYLPEEYGRCDRGGHYHLNPYKDGFAKSDLKREYSSRAYISPVPHVVAKPQTYIPREVLEAIQKDYDQNVFIQNLLHRIPYPFPEKDVNKVISIYRLGTVTRGYLTGAVTFPYFETPDKIQAIQIVKYGHDTKRSGINWLDSYVACELNKIGKKPPVWVTERDEQSKVNCFFGAHLVNEFKASPIVLVEGPKSAIIGMLTYGLPDGSPNGNPIWLATGSRDTFSIRRSQILKGRFIILIPDLSPDGSTYKKWYDNAAMFGKEMPGTSFLMYNRFEKRASVKDKEGKDDIADFIIKQDWRGHRGMIAGIGQTPKRTIEKISTQVLEPIRNGRGIGQLEDRGFIIDQDQTPRFNKADKWQQSYVVHGAWDKEIAEMDQFFETASLPEGPFKLNPYTPITEASGFLKYNLAVAKEQNGNPTFRPYLIRVKELMEYVQVYAE